VSSAVSAVRRDLESRLLAMVAGPEGPANRERIHRAPGTRWFDDDRPIRRVHADASMFVGGLRALLLQSLHPLAMAGVAEHSDYRGDPWGGRPQIAAAAAKRARAGARQRCLPGLAHWWSPRRRGDRFRRSRPE
jgi:uncharacterized protein (DUF2236 family)